MITLRRRSVTFIVMGLACVVPDASPQSPSSLHLPWTGWAQCQITIQAPGYTHRETHQWTITGGGTRNANMEISPATWTVTGNGSGERMSGDTTLSAQWQVDGTVPNVEIGVTRHVDRITVQRWTGHGPARGALTGVETIGGASRPRSIVSDVQQWVFPRVEGATTSTRIAGSSTERFDGVRGPVNPPAGAQGSVACSWDFTRGSQADGITQRGPVGTLAEGRESPQTATPAETPMAPLSQPDARMSENATLNDPARSRAARMTASSGPASSSGETSTAPPTMTTGILPSVLAVPQTSTTAATSTAPTNTPAPASGPRAAATTDSGTPASRPELHGTLLEPPTNVTARCPIVSALNVYNPLRKCDVNWTAVTGAAGYVVTWRNCNRGGIANALGGVAIVCVEWGPMLSHNVGADSASWSTLVYGASPSIWLTAVYPGDARSIAVGASVIP